MRLHQMPLLVVCAQLEEEISRLPEDERGMFLEDLGVTESGVARLSRLPMIIWILFLILQWALTKCVPGPSGVELQPKQRAKFIRILHGVYPCRSSVLRGHDKRKP